MDLASGDDEVNGHRRAELQGRFQPLQPFVVDLQFQVSAATEHQHGEPERVLTAREAQGERHRPSVEGHLDPGVHGEVAHHERTGGDRGHRQ
ncbi:hypothetical protein ACFZB2_38780 [Streptomyces bobili]|uniref:hypothetical protein n=1 Tax=Streptomyces bobili TaxID=67280 RepID=UPI0036E31F3D